uniref:Protein SMG7 isoform X1 n=1 Tax=Rhizophora mucronata TaxID=61149 RepID=A0A2P2JSW7_RHIMU
MQQSRSLSLVAKGISTFIETFTRTSHNITTTPEGLSRILLR